MVMRTDNFSAGGALVGRSFDSIRKNIVNEQGADMAKTAKPTPVAPTHADAMSGAAHAAMRSLGSSGMQTAHVSIDSLNDMHEDMLTDRVNIPEPNEGYTSAKKGQ